MTDKELIWLCAFRYALGRKTYIVSVVCNWLKSHKLSNNTKEIIIKEIGEAEEVDRKEILCQKKLPQIAKRSYYPLGEDCDKKRWLELKKFLKEKK